MGHFLSVVALVSVTLLDSNPLSGKNDRFWHRLHPPSLHGLRQLNFPNVKNDAGQKQYSPCVLRKRRRPKAGDALPKNKALPTFGVSAALSVIAGHRPAMFSRKAG